MDEMNQSSPQNQQILEQQMLEQELMQQQLQGQAAQASAPVSQPIDSSFGVPLVNPSAVPSAQTANLGPVANAVPQQSQVLQTPAPKPDPNAPTLNDFSSANKPAATPQANSTAPTASAEQSQQQQYLSEFDKQRAAAEKIATAQAALEVAKEAQFKDKAQKAVESEQAFDKINSHFQEQYAQRTSSLDSAIEEFKRLAAEKPQTAAEVWDKKSTGQKIQAGIAIALGGIGAALQGGGAVNQAYNIIQKGLQDEADATNASIKNKMIAQEKAGDLAITGAKMAMEAQGVMQETALKKRLLQYEAIESKINQFTAQYQSPQIKENGALLMSKLQQDKVKTRMEFDVLAKKQALMNSVNGMSWEEFNKLPPSVQAQYPKEIVDAMKDSSELTVPEYGKATNKELASAFNKYRAENEPAIAAGKRVLALLKDFNRFTDLQKKSVIETEMGALTGSMKTALVGGGTMTESDFARIEKILGSPTSFAKFPAYEKAKLMTALKKAESDLAMQAKNAGLPPKTADRIYSEAGFKPLIKEK